MSKLETCRTAKPKTSAPSPSKRSRAKLLGETQDGRMVKITPAQWLLAEHLREYEVHVWFEHPVCQDRKWRFDIVDDENAIAYECNGGKWLGGHRRGNAIEEENDKLNTAAVQGWRVIQFTNEQILDGRANEFLAGIYGAK